MGPSASVNNLRPVCTTYDGHDPMYAPIGLQMETAVLVSGRNEPKGKKSSKSDTDRESEPDYPDRNEDSSEHALFCRVKLILSELEGPPKDRWPKQRNTD
jgi:hypothetical protein